MIFDRFRQVLLLPVIFGDLCLGIPSFRQCSVFVSAIDFRWHPWTRFGASDLAKWGPWGGLLSAGGETTLQWCAAGSTASRKSSGGQRREISCSLWLPYAPCLALHWLRGYGDGDVDVDEDGGGDQDRPHLILLLFSLGLVAVAVGFLAFCNFNYNSDRGTGTNNRYKCLFYFAWLRFGLFMLAHFSVATTRQNVDDL